MKKMDKDFVDHLDMTSADMDFAGMPSADKDPEDMTLEELEVGMKKSHILASIAITDAMTTLAHAACVIPNMVLDSDTMHLEVTDDRISVSISLGRPEKKHVEDSDDYTDDDLDDFREERLREY